MPIHYDLDDHVVTITIDRPARRNALDLEHFDALAAAWKRFRDDPDVWVAIVTGDRRRVLRRWRSPRLHPVAHRRRARRPRALPLRHRGGVARPRHLQADRRRGERAVRRGRHGAAQRHRHPRCVPGGGVRDAGAPAGHLREWRHDRPPPAPAPRGPRPWSSCSPRSRSPPRAALELGLLNEIVPRHQLVDRARDWAARITANAPLAIAATKESALRGLAVGTMAEAYRIEARLSRKVLASNDAREGPRAFVEKRPPRWSGT